MSDQALLADLAEIAKRELAYEGPLSLETSLVETLELDSIRLLQLLVAVEDHFEVCLDEGDEEGLETAGDLVRLLKARRA